MNLNKRSTYEKFRYYSDLLTDESVIYVYAKNENLAYKKLDILFSFCNEKNIHPINVYIDINESNSLMNKSNLVKLLRDEENVDIITFTSRDITPFCSEDYYEIRQYLRESNLGIYDLNYESYTIERKPLLEWLGN